MVQTGHEAKAELETKVGLAEQGGRAEDHQGGASGAEDTHDAAEDHHSRADGTEDPHSGAEDLLGCDRTGKGFRAGLRGHDSTSTKYRDGFSGYDETGKELEDGNHRMGRYRKH